MTHEIRLQSLEKELKSSQNKYENNENTHSTITAKWWEEKCMTTSNCFLLLFQLKIF